MSQEVVLSVRDLVMRFGGLVAVDQVAFDVKKNEIFSIIGPNGAGKTTVFNCVSGFYSPSEGNISLFGENITGKSSHIVAKHGLVRTFQNVRLFKNLSVLENLLVAQHNHLSAGFLAGLLNLPSYRRSEKEALDKAVQWLNPQEKKDLAQMINQLRREFDISVLLIEHDMSLIMNISDRIMVMEMGRPLVTGLPEEVRNDPQVIKAYLGE